MPLKPRSLAVTLLFFAATVSALLVVLLPATELTRFRNSLLATTGTPADFDWLPDAFPADYNYETIPPPSEFVSAVQAIGPAVADEQPLMLSLVEHLRSKPKTRGPIQSTTVYAYHEIIEKGRGYCADYTQVFNGLAYSAGLSVREWGMAFDGFGGDGHAFNEIFDRDSGRWVFVDPMNGFYVLDRATGRPLSALEFRGRLIEPDGFQSVSIEPIGTTFLFDSLREAFDYYVQGTDQFYLWFGNDVFSYDANPVVRLLSWSRPLEELAGIMLGIHPKIRIFPTASNGPEIASLLRLPYYVLGLTTLATVLGLILLIQALALLRRSRSSR